MTDNLTDFVMKQLLKHRDRNSIIQSICEQGKLNWTEAERFLKKVEAENKRTIAVGQSPFLFFISVATIIMGIIFLIYNGVFFLDYYNADTTNKILLAQSIPYKGIGLLTGIGMFIGGVIGIFQTAISLFNK